MYLEDGFYYIELGGGGTMYTHVSKCKNDKKEKRKKEKRKNI
jgi:hypothetical protein